MDPFCEEIKKKQVKNVFLEILDNTRNAKSKGGIKKLIFHVMASFVCYGAQAGQQEPLLSSLNETL